MGKKGVFEVGVKLNNALLFINLIDSHSNITITKSAGIWNSFL